MLKETYCLLCRKYAKNTNPRIVKSKNERSYNQIVQYVVVKNLDLLKNNKRKDY